MVILGDESQFTLTLLLTTAAGHITSTLIAYLPWGFSRKSQTQGTFHFLFQIK